MPVLQAFGRLHPIQLVPLRELMARTQGAGGAASHPRAVRRLRGFDPAGLAACVVRSPLLRSRAEDPHRLALLLPAAGRRAFAGGAQTLATETVIAEGLRSADLEAVLAEGARLVAEGLEGKLLLRADSAEGAFALTDRLRARGAKAAPNFLRLHRPPRPLAAARRPWAHARIRVKSAWKITRGSPEVRVAILDDGVDVGHPALQPAVVAQRDFIGGRRGSARPDGDDAHGTACAGIAVARGQTHPGVAPGCSLVAIRIAMGDGMGGWITDDFATADAIDWAWRREGAAVLSNSWGGGAPSEAIGRAFDRARRQGRDGKGSVVVLAAGNSGRPIGFPGDLPGYLTVGASTPRDERKTFTSSDGEAWASDHGPTLHLLAPGVFIHTTDLRGSRGYDPGDYASGFNGTSAATPHVAAAAALMVSANPELSASEVREILGATAKRLAGQTGWTRELGWGRLDVGRAVTMARKTGRTRRRG